MKEYLLKRLIDGYKISHKFADYTLVALPFKFTGKKILVKHSNKKMIIDQDSLLLGSKTFRDKFGRDKKYTLFYYQWQPNKNQTKLEL